MGSKHRFKRTSSLDFVKPRVMVAFVPLPMVVLNCRPRSGQWRQIRFVMLQRGRRDNFAACSMQHAARVPLLTE